MWRLRGIGVWSSSGPLHEGFIEIGDVTVIIGPNDSGKTRLLRFIDAALRNPHPDAEDVLDMFGVASTVDLDAFLDPTEADEEDIYLETKPVQPFRNELELPANSDEVSLGIRPIVGLERLPAWRYGRSLAELPDELRQPVRAAVGYHDERAPLKLEYVGGVDPAILPVAVTVPSVPEEVEAEAGRTLVSLCQALRLAKAFWSQVEPHVGPLEGLPDEEWAPPEIVETTDTGLPSSRWLLQETPSMSSHHPAAIHGCEALQLLAQQMLPDFISREYNLNVVPASPIDIARGATIQIRLARVRSDVDETYGEGQDQEGADQALSFPLRDVASGFQVWLQLALREATARLEMLTQILNDGLQRAHQIGSWRIWHPDEPVPEAAQLELVKLTVERVFESLEDPATVPPESITEDFELVPRPQPNETAPATIEIAPGWLSVQALRSRLYLFDEPEQRLHPALQRDAAGWLSELMHQWGSQCILATHSIAFMSMKGDVRVFEIVRAGGRAAVRQADPVALGPREPLARAMGFDRGELLSRYRAFLFVEGVTDIAVIEELFPETLREARICLLPAYGHRQHAALLDMAVFALGTATPIAALFDGIRQTQIQNLRSSAELRRKARERPDELGTLARMLDLEYQRDDLTIEILTITAPDILDLLDIEAIRDQAAAEGHRGKPFPRHTQARREFRAQGLGRRAEAYKRFIRERYGVSTSEASMRLIARRMKASRIIPSKLEDILNRVDRLALEAETRR